MLFLVDAHKLTGRKLQFIRQLMISTRIILWLMIAGFTVSGVWEAALILGGLQMLGAGRNAAKPD